jgi:hypothetical protein
MPRSSNAFGGSERQPMIIFTSDESFLVFRHIQVTRKNHSWLARALKDGKDRFLTGLFDVITCRSDVVITVLSYLVSTLSRTES